MMSHECGMKKILVAMSGGVDSSVAAYLLKNAGNEVVGVTLKLWHSDELSSKKSGCCSVEDISDARRVCHKLGIKHYVFNFEKVFKERIVKNFVDEYIQGRTPNPCIVCNEKIKFNLLLEKAISLGFDYLATGHYARVVKDKSSHYLLLKGVDEKKDQSYFLYRLTQNKLSRVLFPVGGLTKKDVREIAKKNGLPVADKKESYDVCFIGGKDYRSFVLSQIGNKSKILLEGNFVSSKGQILGKHRGIIFYTTGQRSGLGVSSRERLYVVRLDKKKNEVVVGSKEECFSKSFFLKDVVWTIHRPELPIRCSVKIRYLNKEEPAEIDNVNGAILVDFFRPQFAIAPGQSAVFYDGDTVIGGGIIDFVVR